MRRFVRSSAYVRTRAVTGSLFIVFGAAIVARTVSAVGLDVRAIVPLIMGLALLALGSLRIRDFLRLHNGQP